MARKKRRQAIEQLQITAYAAEGKSIGHLEDGKVVFVAGAIPGDVVSAWPGKEKKTWMDARLVRVNVPSPDRVQPFCPHFGLCGGCKWQMLPYEKQLQYKQQQVGDQLQRISGIELPEIQPIIGSAADRYYRNKLEFTFSATRYRTSAELAEAGDEKLPEEGALGFHAPGLFDKVVPIQTCFLQPDPTNEVLRVLRDYTERNGLTYYNFKTHEGWLRNVVLRVARTGQVLLNLVLAYEDVEAREAILAHLLQEIPQITSLHYTINQKVNDTLYDQDIITVKGPGYITEMLEDFSFKISPKSFFQTNTQQAERMYQEVRTAAGLTGTEVLYDLYCGTGSIGIFCSRQAGKIIGIEAVADAVTDAKANAELNGLSGKCQFYAGDVSKICTPDFFREHGRPDVLITDPPRAGMHEDLINQILAIRAPRVVYVSCNPATQARDLALLDRSYRVTWLQPLDLFPHTHHIENIAVLELKA
ncbi:MAG: 23S rRNA (uracil(1939)-C(5))-methyltransferase RlmD [Sphingobacteriales bacterium]|nr:MAG: 23S rRNA (uracil(1939)-C(5))-methyltransferase RlmD [Sphingobacteriales bacterium]